MLNFKPIFDSPLKKIVGGAPITGGVYASKSWPFYGTCKNFRAQHPVSAEIWHSDKVDFVGTIAHNKLHG